VFIRFHADINQIFFNLFTRKAEWDLGVHLEIMSWILVLRFYCMYFKKFRKAFKIKKHFVTNLSNRLFFKISTSSHTESRKQWFGVNTSESYWWKKYLMWDEGRGATFFSMALISISIPGRKEVIAIENKFLFKTEMSTS
jgi:hypothetical protein